MLEGVIENFAYFENLHTQTHRVWMYPIMIWGDVVLSEDRRQIVKTNMDLVGLSLIKLLQQVLECMSCSSKLDIDGSNVFGLYNSLQALSNFAHHETMAPWLSLEVRLALRSNRLIQEFARVEWGTTCGIQSFVRRPEFWNAHIGYIPPVRTVRSTGQDTCTKCGVPTFRPVRCAKCDKVAYCSFECRQDHRPLHAKLCKFDPAEEVDSAAAAVNAPLSDAILLSRPVSSSVYLLEYSRSPQSFRSCFLTCPKLQECHALLIDNGYDTELPSGAKIFVSPDQFQPVMQTLSAECWELKPRHIIVNDDFEEAVVQTVNSLRSSDRIKQKTRAVLELGKDLDHAQASTEPSVDFDESTGEGAATACPQRSVGADLEAVPFIVKRTFIHIPVQSSLWSDPGGQKTASTTDADPRCGPNPRLTYQRVSQ